MRRLIAIEARVLWREPASLWLLAILAALCGAAVLAGHGRMSSAIRAHAAAEAAAGEALASLEARLASDLSARDRVLTTTQARLPALRPPPPLLDFGQGRFGFEPTGSTVGLRSRPKTLGKDAELPSPALLLHGDFDLDFLALLVMPLVLVILGIRLFATDRDQGTAALILTQAGTLHRVLLARSLVRLGPVVAMLLLSAGALLVLGPDLPGRLAAAGAWLAIALALQLFWWGVALMVNACRIGSETAALALVGLWALLSLAAPAAIASLSDTLHPPPSCFLEIAASRAAEVAATGEWEMEHPELFNDEAARAAASVQRAHAIADRVGAAVMPIRRAFAESLRAQQQLAGRLALLAPPMVAQLALEDAAGTGIRQSLAFRNQAETYLAALRTALAPHVARGTGLSLADLQALPRFDPALPPPAPWLPLVYLLALAAGSTLVAGRLLSRPPFA